MFDKFFVADGAVQVNITIPVTITVGEDALKVEYGAVSVVGAQATSVEGSGSVSGLVDLDKLADGVRRYIAGRIRRAANDISTT